MVWASFILSIVALVIAYAKWQHPKTTDSPEILVDIEWRIDDSFFEKVIAYLSVKNVGRATAYDVAFKYDCNFQIPELRPDIPAKTLDDIKYLKDGISGISGIIPDDQKTEIAFSGDINVFLEKKEKCWNKKKRHTKIKVKYRSIKKRIWRYKQTFTIDFYRGSGI